MLGVERFNLHVLPVADSKDGYLATHSLMSTVTVLLNASHRILNHIANGSIAERYLSEADLILSKDNRKLLAETFSSLRPNDTLLLLHDPRLTSVGLLIETSVWEAALCSVQRTDYRHFAHGRHVWLAKRPAETMLMSLTGVESRAIWEDLERLAPTGVRRVSFDRGNCGRFQNALGILHGLTIVEALGFATGIDPGKPGVGSFARDIYGSPFLKDLSKGLSAAVRHKYAKHIAHDDPSSGDVDMMQSFAGFKARLGSANFAGVVLDYDGTIVTTEGRFQPPSTEMVTELSRLLEDGIPIAIATGRGGSAGEDLREVIPKAHHPQFLIGYYNGDYIRPLSVDIRNEPPPTHSVITDVETWLARNADLFKEYVIRNSHVQVTIDFPKLHNVDEFDRRFLSNFSAVARVRMSRSGHTVDICPVETCKTAVVKALADLAGASVESILCIGDRGGHFGNDHVMLGTPNGISVDDVCHRPDVCWSFFGATMTGPKALVHILRSLRRGAGGRIQLNVEELSNTAT
jgi:HAD superfamily hydrolase (TIGR01484 family)